MAIQFSDSVRNAMLDQIEVISGPSAKVVIYSGSAPATVAAAASGTALATVNLPADWAGNAAAGRKDFVVPQSTVASAAGTAGYFRITTSAGVATMQGTVGTTSGDLNLDNVSLASGQTVQITSWQITAPGA
jgi:hypothetical protein